MPDKNTLYKLGSVLFRDANVRGVAETFENPVRQMGLVGLGQLESLAMALVAGRGRPEDLPLALLRGALEQADAPLKLLELLIDLPLRKGGEGLPWVPGPL